MLCDVLQIIHKLVRLYSPETIPSGRMSEEGGTSEAPGAVILMNLLHDSPFLHQLLATLHSGYKILKEEEDVRGTLPIFQDFVTVNTNLINERDTVSITYQLFILCYLAAKSHNVDRACLLSLQLLEEGLEKGESWSRFKKLNSYCWDVTPSYLRWESLPVRGLNPATKQADHLLVSRCEYGML